MARIIMAFCSTFGLPVISLECSCCGNLFYMIYSDTHELQMKHCSLIRVLAISVSYNRQHLLSLSLGHIHELHMYSFLPYKEPNNYSTTALSPSNLDSNVN